MLHFSLQSEVSIKSHCDYICTYKGVDEPYNTQCSSWDAIHAYAMSCSKAKLTAWRGRRVSILFIQRQLLSFLSPPCTNYIGEIIMCPNRTYSWQNIVRKYWASKDLSLTPNEIICQSKLMLDMFSNHKKYHQLIRNNLSFNRNEGCPLWLMKKSNFQLNVKLGDATRLQRKSYWNSRTMVRNHY